MRKTQIEQNKNHFIIQNQIADIGPRWSVLALRLTTSVPQQSSDFSHGLFTQTVDWCNQLKVTSALFIPDSGSAPKDLISVTVTTCKLSTALQRFHGFTEKLDAEIVINWIYKCTSTYIFIRTMAVCSKISPKIMLTNWQIVSLQIEDMLFEMFCVIRFFWPNDHRTDARETICPNFENKDIHVVSFSPGF